MTATANGYARPADVARDYIARGFSPIPVPPRQKAPALEGWEQLRITAHDVPRYFGANQNIGVLNGEPSGWLVDVDLDHELARELADEFLPPTSAMFGRAGSRRSHRLYVVTGPIETHQRRLPKVDGKAPMIVELRSTGSQTVFPGSVHPSGERIEWDSAGEPSPVAPGLLLAAVDALAEEVRRRLAPSQPRREHDAYHRPDIIDRARKYLAKIPPAVSGQGGHDQTFHAACVLVQGFALDRGPALELLGEYNQTCQPPWTDRELEHKIDDAINAPGERGYLLDDDRPQDRPAGKTTRNRRSTDDNEGIVKRLADEICGANRFARDASGKVFRYREGAYRARGEQFIQSEVKRLCVARDLSKEWSSRLALEVVEFIRVDARELWERPPLDVVNVANGLLRLSDVQLVDHSPEHLSPIQIPVKFDPDARCKAIDRFAADVFPPDARTLAYEVPAWLMTPDVSIQKAVLLLGAGGNGKSTWLRMLVEFLGKDNCVGLSLHKLEGNRFSVARLLGKLANICADLPTEHLASTSTFKALTGTDFGLEGEHKFRDGFSFDPYCRLVFSANSPPRSGDSSEGFFDRWLVVPFDARFRGTDRELTRKELDAQLSAPAELSGLLNRAIEAWHQIKDRGGRLSEPESVREAWRQFHATTDPLSVWLDQFTIDDPEAVVPRQVLRSAYGASCERAGRPALTDTAFGIAIGKSRPNVTTGNRTVNGRRQWCYVGIGLRDDGFTGVQTVQGVQG